MKLKKNINKLIFYTYLFFLIPVLNVFANPQGLPARTFGELYTGLRNLLNWFFSFLVIASVIGVIIGGFMFISSGGDSGKVASARNWIIYSLVGILVGAFAIAIVNWVAGINFA